MRSRTLRNDAGQTLHAAVSLLMIDPRKPASHVLITHEAAIATRGRGLRKWLAYRHSATHQQR
ncbi:hypothetical protein CUJ87_08790 [Paraburkholderia caledonica]|nr:hypothetical protein CUJ87_08790 [Paraburkholderia caledonica]